jgi:3-hydroxybutyryl-CoA dehydrogenase
MGLGITYVASLHAQIPRILLYDRSSTQLQKSLKLMDKLLDKEIGKGRLTEGVAKETRQRIEAKVVSDDPAKGMEGLEDVDMVVEVSLESRTISIYFIVPDNV